MTDAPATPAELPHDLGVLAYASPRDRGVAWAFWLSVVLLVGLVARLAFSTARPVDQQALERLPDQLEYWASAAAWLEGKPMGFEDPEAGETLYAFRMPGYPMLIAACRANPRAVTWLQAVLDVSSAYAVWLIGRRAAGPFVGLLAATAVSFNPYLIYFSSLLLSETMFTCCLAWGVCLVTRRGVGPRAAGVLVLMLSVYVRPSAIGLGVVAAVAAFVGDGSLWRRAARGTIIAALATIVLGFVLLPWASRNHAVLGTWIWTTTNGGYTAYDSFNPQADGSSNQLAFRSTDRLALLVIGPDARRRPLHSANLVRDLGEVRRSQLLTSLAWDYARDHPARVVTLAVAKLGRFWSPVPLSADFGGNWLYVAAGGLYVVPLFLMAAAGVVRGGLGRRTTLLLLLPALYFSAVHCVFVGSLRYRVPCDVPLAVLASAGVGSFGRPRAVAA